MMKVEIGIKAPQHLSTSVNVKPRQTSNHVKPRQTTSKVFKGVEKGEGCTHVESLHAFRERTSKGNLERMLPVKGGEGCTRLVNLERMPRTL